MSRRQQPQNSTSPAELQLPDELVSSQSKLVYLTLAREGEQSPSQLARRLQLNLSEIYPVLRKLRAQGFVEKRNDQFTLEGR